MPFSIPSSSESKTPSSRGPLTALARALPPAGIALVVTLTVTGCGSSVNTTLTKEWQTEVGEEARTVAVEPKQGHLLVGKDKNTVVIDAAGRVTYGQEEEEGGLSGFLNEAKEAATSVDTETNSPLAAGEANQLDYVVLSDLDLALAFDYTSSDDIIRAIDLTGGEQRWEQAGYRWSLEKYRSAGQEIAREVASQAGAGAGRATGALNAELTRSRFVENLVVPLPQQNGLLLKTVRRLQFVDLSTGEARWSIPDVLGSRLMGAKRLASGDLILAVGSASLIGAISGSNEVMRLDPESGEVVWRSDHDAQELRDLQVRGERLLLTNAQGEMMAYRIGDGTQVLDAEPGWTLDLTSEMAVTARYRGNRYSEPLTSPPAAAGDGQVYAPAVIERQTAGDPDLGVRAYSLSSGAQTWASDPVETMRDVRDLTLTGDHVVGRVTRGRPGALTGDSYQRVVAWNPADGTIAWDQRISYEAPKVHAIRSGAFGQPPPSKLNLVTAGDRICVAGDTSIVGLEASTGEVASRASAEASGAVAHLAEAGSGLMVLREEGVAFYDTPGLPQASSSIEFDDPLVTFEQRGDHLFARTEEALYVVDVAQQALAGTVPAEGIGETAVSGNLQGGVVPTNDGQSVFILTGDRVVQKYRVP